MSPPKHLLTQYIIILSKKANKFNHYALYHFCDNKITNTKRLVHSHLKSCNKFKEQYLKDKRNRILYPERYEEYQSEIEVSSTSTSTFLLHGIYFKIIFF